MSVKSAHDSRREVLELVETVGIRVAIEAAIAVCEDEDAPAPARATAAGLLLRAGALGGFARNHEPAGQKEPHEMTADELQREIDRVRGSIPKTDEGDGSAFD